MFTLILKPLVAPSHCNLPLAEHGLFLSVLMVSLACIATLLLTVCSLAVGSFRSCSLAVSGQNCFHFCLYHYQCMCFMARQNFKHLLHFLMVLPTSKYSHHCIFLTASLTGNQLQGLEASEVPVSYTHLTLPTKVNV